MYVIYCQNKPKSTALVHELKDTHFLVSTVDLLFYECGDVLLERFMEIRACTTQWKLNAFSMTVESKWFSLNLFLRDSIGAKRTQKNREWKTAKVCLVSFTPFSFFSFLLFFHAFFLFSSPLFPFSSHFLSFNFLPFFRFFPSSVRLKYNAWLSNVLFYVAGYERTTRLSICHRGLSD